MKLLDLSGGTGGRSGQYVYTAPNGVVVTSSGPVYTNSNYYYMQYLFDGNNSSMNYWLTSSSDGTLIFDMGSLNGKIIKKIDVVGRARTDGYSKYSISISDDNVNYKEIVPQVNDPAIDHKMEFNVSTEGKRYIKFNITHDGNWGMQLKSIDFYVEDTRYLIKDNGKYKKYIQKSGLESFAGIMTSEASNGIIESITTNSEVPGWEAWKMFDGINTGYDQTYWSSNDRPTLTEPIIVNIKLVKPTAIKKYEFDEWNEVYSPLMQKFFGSNDGENWEKIYENTGGTTFSTTINLTNTTKYKYYKWEIYTTCGYAGGKYYNVTIRELRLYTDAISEWETVGEESNTPLTEQLFLDNGMSDISIIDESGYETLETDNPEILIYLEDDVPQKEIEITASPFPEIAIGKEDIPIEDIKKIIIINNDINKIEAVPKMTSNTKPSGIVSASSSFSNSYLPWRAFNRINDSEGWVTVNGEITGWLAYEFPNEICIEGYTLTAPNSSSQYKEMAKKWVFSAYNEKENVWDILDERENEIFGVNEKKYYEFYNTKKYKKYKIEILENNGDSRYSGIQEMNMFERNKPQGVQRFLISYDKGITWNGRSIVDISNFNDVKTNGYTWEEINELDIDSIRDKTINGTIRLAIYLEADKLEEESKVEQIILDKKIYNKSPSLSNLSVLINTLEAFNKPNIYITRDGASWKEIQLEELEEFTGLPNGTDLQVKVVLDNGEEIYAISYSWN